MGIGKWVKYKRWSIDHISEFTFTQNSKSDGRILQNLSLRMILFDVCSVNQARRMTFTY